MTVDLADAAATEEQLFQSLMPETAAFAKNLRETAPSSFEQQPIQVSSSPRLCLLHS